MNFNANQLKALDINKNTAVSAGAGSGKTRVLTSRYIKLLEEGNINVSEIVAITFTNKAALEMKERIRSEIDKKIEEGNNIKKWLQIKDDFQMANISTIHSFCMNIVRENAAEIGIDPEFTIMDEYQGKVLLDNILIEEIKELLSKDDKEFLKLVDYIGEYKEDKLIDSLKGEIKNVYGKLRSEGRNVLDVEALDGFSSLVLDLIKAIDFKFKNIKFNNAVVDFNDIEIMTKDILKNQNIIKRYRKTYKRFLIDEFQDTNEVQKQIIYSFVSEDGKIIPGSLFIVGDHKQAIYGFRGTDYRVFREVMKDIDNTVELDICYRSRPSIIQGINDSFMNIINNYEALKYPDNKELKDEKSISILTIPGKNAMKNDNGIRFDKTDELMEKKLSHIRKKRFSYLHERIVDEEAGLISNSIIGLVREGKSLRDIAVLLRSRNGLEGITRSLNDANINYVVLGGLGFFQRQEIIDLMYIYSAVLSPYNRKSLYGAMRSPGFAINDKVLYHVNKCLMEENNIIKALDCLKNRISVEEYLKLESAINIILSIRSDMPGKRVYDILSDILKKTDFNNKMLSFKDGDKSYRNIEKLLSLASEFDKNPMLKPGEFYEYIKEYSEVSNEEEAPLDTENSDAVKIMTIHASKGLEFECVIIPYLNKIMGERTEKEFKKRLFIYDEGRILSSAAEEDTINGIIQRETTGAVEEEQRILYVAATRAKSKLILINKEKKAKAPKEECNKKRNYIDIFKCDSKYISQDIIHEIPMNMLDREIEKKPELIEDSGLIDINMDFRQSFNFSISRYFEFKSCPRRYFYKYVENIPEKYYCEAKEKKQGYGAKLGTAVHEALELGISADNLKNISTKHDIDEGLLRRFINSFEAVEKEYRGLYDNFKLIESIREYEIKYRYKCVTFTGFIDRVDIYEDNGRYFAAVIDYKTNYIRDNIGEILEKYTPQLTLYSLGVRDLVRVFGKEIDSVKTYLYLLDKKILKEVDGLKAIKDFDNIYNEMVEIDSRENIEDFSMNLTTCSSCGYYKLCHR